MFLEISQNSQENTCATVSFLIKLQAKVCNFIEKRLWHRCFPVTFTKFLRTPFLTEHLFYRPRPGDCFWIKVFKGVDFKRFRSQTYLYGNQNYHSSINRLIIISTIEYLISTERFKCSLFDQSFFCKKCWV